MVVGEMGELVVGIHGDEDGSGCCLLWNCIVVW